MNKTQQKHITNVNNFLLKTFKTSTELHNSLKKEKNTMTSTLSLTLQETQQTKGPKEIGKGDTKKKTESKLAAQADPETLNFLNSCDIKAIDNYKKMEISEKNLEIIK